MPMKSTSLFRALLLAASLGLAGASVQAQDLGAIRARMEQRVATVDALKDRKLLGENNRGFLEPRGNLTPPDNQIMSEENADRSAVYAAIAAQAGTTPDQVGRARAQKIASASKSGVWIQAPDGNWFEKP